MEHTEMADSGKYSDGRHWRRMSVPAIKTREHLLWKPHRENWLDSVASLATFRALLGFSGYFQTVVKAVEHSHSSKTNYSPYTDSVHFL